MSFGEETLTGGEKGKKKEGRKRRVFVHEVDRYESPRPKSCSFRKEEGRGGTHTIAQY